MSGMYTNGTTAATPPLTGNEQASFDTELTQGVNPQQEAITVDQIRNYVLGNTGTASKTGNGTASATTGAATLNAGSGVITSESITTAAGSDYTLTLTNSQVLATSVVLASVANGTNTTEGLAINRVQPSAGQVVIHVRNTNASVALNGTIKIAFAVIN